MKRKESEKEREREREREREERRRIAPVCRMAFYAQMRVEFL